MKLSVKLDRLKAVAPKVSKFGQLFRDKRDTKKRYKKITLHTLFVSNKNTLLLRDHIFESKKKARTPQEWSEWFSKLVPEDDDEPDGPQIPNLQKIHLRDVLGGIALRTGKQWSVKRIIGWTGSNVKHKVNHSKVAKSRHHAKR